MEKLLSTPEENNHPLYLMMERNARRLLNLINQLLDLSKLEAGSLKLETKTENITKFLKILAASFSSLSESRNIIFNTHFPNIEYEASIDKDKLEKIVINLLSNAFKFSPDRGTIEFLTDIKFGMDNSSNLEIIVTDTGIGIDQKEKEKIFDRFYQVDSSQSREREGTGIGLALTKELVDLHNGCITVTCELGKGTSFKVIIPIVILNANHGTADLPEHSDPKIKGLPDIHIFLINPSSENEATLLNNNIREEKPILLIVEDNQELSGHIASLFESHFQILEAENGKAGLKQALKTIPDIVISDVMMPVMDGMELCHILKIRYRHQPYSGDFTYS